MPFCCVLQNIARTVDEVSRLGRIAEQTVTNDTSLLCDLQKDKNVALLEVELKKLASTVQKLAVGNVGGAGAPKPCPPRGRRPQPQSRRPPFQTSQSSSWTRQPMAQVQDPPRLPLRHRLAESACQHLQDWASPIQGPCLCWGQQLPGRRQSPATGSTDATLGYAH